MRKEKPLSPVLGVALAALVITVAVGGRGASARRSNAEGVQALGPDLSGSYRLAAATDPEGGSYGGTVDISRLGAAYRVAWTVTGGGSYEGVGVQMDDALAIGWGSGRANRGVVVYRIQGGRLSGKWTITDMKGALGTEELEGAPGLQGSYRIVHSTVPGAARGYAGTVNITASGDTYIVEWRLASGENYKGVGVRQGDLLAVGWSPGRGSVAVATYRQKGAVLKGVWAIPGEKRLGAETLSKG
ncbi:MAG TPA: hypothetical protein VGX92_01955 [Pyrinomonadaceae bacterium]|nr:hypothetical protein [Pyrinomonadaceae bacterium]